MGVVSVRLEDADEQWLVDHGHKPGTFARAAVHEAIRREEVRASRAWLEANRVPSDGKATAFFRAERDGRGELRP
jgi:hypothetical protein